MNDGSISRQAAIEALEREKTYASAFRDGYTKINVFEKYNMGLADGIKAIKQLPSIQPERKKGKWQWLSSTYDRTPCEMRYMCSECHHETILHSNETSYPWEKFCPNCGADMRGEIWTG